MDQKRLKMTPQKIILKSTYLIKLSNPIKTLKSQSTQKDKTKRKKQTFLQICMQ